MEYMHVEFVKPESELKAVDKTIVTFVKRMWMCKS